MDQRRERGGAGGGDCVRRLRAGRAGARAAAAGAGQRRAAPEAVDPAQVAERARAGVVGIDGEALPGDAADLDRPTGPLDLAGDRQRADDVTAAADPEHEGTAVAAAERAGQGGRPVAVGQRRPPRA